MIYTIGEALIDFIPDEKGIELKNVKSFTKSPGGAPANVACAIAKLGGSSSFIGMLGQDPFGDFLIDILNSCCVDTSHVVRTKEAQTSLAFVSLKDDGNRDFAFYRKPGADMLLSESDIDDTIFNTDDLLHFGSVDLIDAPCKKAHFKAINAVRKVKGLVSFDPNVRLPLWDSPDKCREAILEFLPLANILKVSDEEIEFLTHETDENKAISTLFTGEVELIVLTKGSKGAKLYTKQLAISAGGYAVSVVDTTGAGDAFVGSFLYYIMKNQLKLNCLTKEDAYRALKFSNATAAISTTKYGAINSLPTNCEVLDFLKVQS